MRIREAIASAGVDVPEEILPFVEAGFAPLMAAIEDLAALDFGGMEPFVPGRLADDAPTG